MKITEDLAKLGDMLDNQRLTAEANEVDKMIRKLAGKMHTVSPAYGKDYKDEEAARKAWEDGKDFKIEDVADPAHGQYINNADALDHWKGDQVKIRFNKKSDILVVKI